MLDTVLQSFAERPSLAVMLAIALGAFGLAVFGLVILIREQCR